jgi:hypothetical protein
MLFEKIQYSKSTRNPKSFLEILRLKFGNNKSERSIRQEPVPF